MVAQSLSESYQGFSQSAAQVLHHTDERARELEKN